MKKSPTPKQGFSQADKNKIILVSIFLGTLLLAFGILVGLLLRQRGFRLPILAAQSQATPTLQPAVMLPTDSVPTVACEPQTFVLGEAKFQVQNLSLQPDSSVALPPAASGVAYWLETPESNNLVMLSPTPENISLQNTLTTETTAKVTWADCSSKTFSLAAPEPYSMSVSVLRDQLTSGLTIFIQSDAEGNGIIVRGELVEMTFPQ